MRNLLIGLAACMLLGLAGEAMAQPSVSYDGNLGRVTLTPANDGSDHVSTITTYSYQSVFYFKVYVTYGTGMSRTTYVYDSYNSPGGHVNNMQVSQFYWNTSSSTGHDDFDFSVATASNFPNLLHQSSGSTSYGVKVLSGQGGDTITLSPSNQSYADAGTTASSSDFDSIFGGDERDIAYGPSSNEWESVLGGGANEVTSYGKGTVTGGSGAELFDVRGASNVVDLWGEVDLIAVAGAASPGSNWVNAQEVDPTNPSGGLSKQDWLILQNSCKSIGFADDLYDQGDRDGAPQDDIEKEKSKGSGGSGQYRPWGTQ